MKWSSIQKVAVNETNEIWFEKGDKAVPRMAVLDDLWPYLIIVHHLGPEKLGLILISGE